MLVSRSSISVQVSKKIIGNINKWGGPNKHWGLEKNSKIVKRGRDVHFGTQE